MPIRNISTITEKITSGAIQSIAVLAGAGLSCAAGLPDFRSPGGMYATLDPGLLTASPAERHALSVNPTLAVDFQLFRRNQFPYLELRRPFIVGALERPSPWQPTLGHYFVRLLHDKGMLRRLYTTNIDGLDDATGIQAENICHVHGTLSRVSCEFCKAPYNRDEFLEKVKSNIRDIYGTVTDGTAPTVSTHILCHSCRKPGVKPSTVLYGRSLPRQYGENVKADFPHNVDLLLVLGTSLTVMPSCGIVNMVSNSAYRVVVNNERVGESLGLDYESTGGQDIFIEGGIDQGVGMLVKQLGWVDDLLKYRDSMCPQSKAVLELLTIN